jgi:hypothetical protein
MHSNPRQGVHRERRRHYAKEALGIGYRAFNVELPAWMKPQPNDGTLTAQEPTDTAARHEFEDASASAWTQALMHSLAVAVFLLSVLVASVFFVRAGSLLLQFMSYKPESF